ncbi:type VI secretion system membrane subunit TssM [Pandoraea sp. NPDC090278]|uniref:type VI secretion system membrane subunit TssM n=1 Tax=Pandoraea sp. NPDC090278 TaxID=3364391 RepID=UPI00383BE880
MDSPKRLDKGLVTKLIVVSLAIVLLAVAIWWLGPLLGLNDMRPLAGVGIRVTVIVLLLALVLFWLQGLPLVFIGGAALCLLIWQAGPLLVFGNQRPLEPTTPRIVLIAVVLFLSLIYLVYLMVLRIQSNQGFRKTVLSFGKKNDEEPVAEAEIEAVTTRVEAGLRRLKTLRTGNRLTRLLDGRSYLYELPWYLTVGGIGAGKTTALCNAGLRFPVAEANGSAHDDEKGSNPPAWRFTNEAVLIDPAGHYTSQEITSKPEVIQAEWRGFLGLLRKYRGRAPINGVLVTVSVTDLVEQSTQDRADAATRIRSRLAELRRELGIQFPIYVVVTKLDLLTGFAEYFQSLGSEGRTQSWGFTLPVGKNTKRGKPQLDLAALCREEMRELAARVEAGTDDRLLEEFDENRRRALFDLLNEFESLTEPLADLIDQIFVDSRYDDTEHSTMLRGVYFTSAAQTGDSVGAAKDTIQGHVRDAKSSSQTNLESGQAGSLSYFLPDLFTKRILSETHLVKPNLRWEFRFRLLRWIGHALWVVLFLWLAAGLYASFGRNSNYLEVVQQKAKALAAQVTSFYKKPEPAGMPEVLAAAHDLPAYSGLNLADPTLDWRYGLYTVPPELDAATFTHSKLQDNLLVPYLVRRVETVLTSAVAGKDAKRTYDTLRVYLMLHDMAKFNASDVRSWVRSDWATGNGADAFGGRVAILEHLDDLLNGSRAVQSPYAKNEALVRSARDFLDTNTSIERLYDRAKVAMIEEAPQEFTLIRAVGPQAGTVFTRASGEPLERGIPGLFTYAGYHDLFNARLPEFVAKAQGIDAWVMGRATGLGAKKKTLEQAAGKLAGNDPLTQEIRRLYLTEYARRWEDFLSDIRAVTGNNLAFDLEILRNLAAPDSPLARLGRAAVVETTLSRPVESEDKSLTDKALSALEKKTEKVSGMTARAEARQERELVDSRFAALREVVTGQADVKKTDGQNAGKAQLDGIAGMVNAYYTTLVVANNALNTRNLPPPTDAGSQLRMEAAKLPVPFKAVLADLVVQGTRDVNKGIGDILIAQMDAVIGESCRSAIDGKYPFTPTSKQDVDPEDFARVFAAGGVLDDFFQKVLAPHVDTTVSPWRYKLTAPDVPPVAGPSLVPFQRAKEIREVFFREPGARKMAWKVDLKVVELDPEIVELNMDFDGQSLRYVHGPVIPLKITWPGPRGGQNAEIKASPRIRPETSTLAANGPWALMRVIAKGKLAGSATASHFLAEYEFDGRKAQLDINTGSLANPWTTGLLQGFQCPGRSG